MKSIEEIKFECKERALQLEIERNPESCLHCNVWRLGGEMSVSIMKCKYCGERKAFRNIKEIIEKYSIKLDLTYNDSWDLAYKCLEEKQKEVELSGRAVYFDEDYFHIDLPIFYEKLLKEAEIKKKELNYKINRKSNFFKNIFKQS